MSDGMIFGITLKGTGGESIAGEVRLSRDALKGLSQESDAASGNINKLESSKSKLAATSGTTAAELFKAAAAAGAYRAVVMGAIDKTNEQTAALMGLASAARYAGEDVTKSMGAASSLTADGMMSMREGALALKNLLSRGFSLEQSVELIGRFKDSAAFGKQASLEFGEAVVSATEGIKNENSILVDNAGVTKNVSVMWKEYAAQIGVGADQLTLAQKRQAEYSGILRETEGQLGNAALASNTLAGSTARLHKSTNDAAVAFGTALLPAATGITEAFTYLIDTAVKPLVFGIQMIGINASMASQQFVTSMSFITSPSQWSTAGIAAYRKEMQGLADLGEEMAIEAARKMNEPAQAPDIGKDTGARRHDSDPGTAAKAAAELQKKLDKEVSDLQSAQFKRQMEELGVSAEQTKVYEMAMHGASRAQINMAQAAAETIDKLKGEEKAQRDATKAAEAAAKLFERKEAAAFRTDQSLGSERAGLDAVVGQNKLADPNLQGDARVVAERAIATASEDAKYKIQVDALNRETELMEQRGELTWAIATTQAERLEVMEETHQARMLGIAQKYMTEKERFDALSWDRQVGTVSAKMAQMTQVAATKSRAMFEINKVASLAHAAVDGASAIMSSFKWGASWGGVWGGIGMAALAAAETAAIISQINSAQFGGGGSTPASVGAGGGIPSMAANTGAPVSVQSSGQTQQSAPPVTFNIYANGTFVGARDFVETEIVPHLQDVISNSDVLLIDPRSRQAQLLGA